MIEFEEKRYGKMRFTKEMAYQETKRKGIKEGQEKKGKRGRNKEDKSKGNNTCKKRKNGSRYGCDVIMIDHNREVKERKKS